MEEYLQEESPVGDVGIVSEMRYVCLEGSQDGVGLLSS